MQRPNLALSIHIQKISSHTTHSILHHHLILMIKSRFLHITQYLSFQYLIQKQNIHLITHHRRIRLKKIFLCYISNFSIRHTILFCTFHHCLNRFFRSLSINYRQHRQIVHKPLLHKILIHHHLHILKIHIIPIVHQQISSPLLRFNKHSWYLRKRKLHSPLSHSYTTPNH